jgi:molybdopterin synthase sulfur carrier subunit
MGRSSAWRDGEPAARAAQATAAVTTISIFHSGLASAACTVARGGVWPEALADGKALRVACNQQMADAATPLSEGCELAFVPPVTGG